MVEDDGARSGEASIPSSEDWIRHDWTETGRASAAVVESVSAVSGRDPLALPPLYERIDPDALDTLLRTESNGVQVAFEYAGMSVRMGADGSIGLAPYAADH